MFFESYLYASIAWVVATLLGSYIMGFIRPIDDPMPLTIILWPLVVAVWPIVSVYLLGHKVGKMIQRIL